MGPGDRIDPPTNLCCRGVARLGLDQDRVGEKRGTGGDVCELAGKLAVDKMKGLVANQPGGRGVPERSGASVSEGDLVAVGKGEQIPEAATPRARSTFTSVARSGERRRSTCRRTS